MVLALLEGRVVPITSMLWVPLPLMVEGYRVEESSHEKETLDLPALLRAMLNDTAMEVSRQLPEAGLNKPSRVELHEGERIL